MRTPFLSSNRIAIPVICMLAALMAGCASKSRLPEPSANASENVASGVATSGPTGVQRVFGIFSPYRVSVQQGNFISREMVAQLKEGMRTKDGVTPEQVRFVLGTPLLTDIFHANRWDYVFRLKKGNGEVISSHVTAFFKDNRLVSIEGGTLPTEQEYLALIAGAAPAQPSK